MAATAGTVLFLDESRTGHGVSQVTWFPSTSTTAEQGGVDLPLATTQSTMSLARGIRAIWDRLVQLHLRHYEETSKLPPEYWFQGH